jgi:hypothetical protein
MRTNLAAVGLVCLVIAIGNSYALLDLLPENQGLRIGVVSVYVILSFVFVVRGFLQTQDGEVAKFIFLICLSAFTIFNGLQMITTFL